MAIITFLAKTLGCRVNQAETKQIVNELISLGYQPFGNQSSPKVIILNTCVVTQKGERESAKTIRHLSKQYPKSLLVVTGCAANLWLKEGQSKIPSTCLFVANEEKSLIPKIIKNRLPLSSRKKSLKNKLNQSDFRVFIKIQDGCNQFCTYCLVPLVRNKIVSQLPVKIIKNVNQANLLGGKEAILSGINLSLYGQELTPPISLNQLIKEILKKTNIPRLSLSSLKPELINQGLLEIFNNEQKQARRLSTYLHLSLQSASTEVLARMGRQNNLNSLKKTLLSLKEIVPEITLRADIIVGFPGETEQEFEATLSFVKETGISFVHSFKYSPRPGTVAQKMINKKHWSQVPEQIKKIRQKKLLRIVQKNQQKQAQGLIDSVRPVLILKETRKGWWGLSDNYWPTNVIFNQSEQKNYLGKIVPVKIVSFQSKILQGNFFDSN